MSSKNHSTIYSESWEERGARQSDLESMNQGRKETEQGFGVHEEVGSGVLLSY